MEIPEKLKLEYLLALDNHIETVGKENKEVTLKKIFEITRDIANLGFGEKDIHEIAKGHNNNFYNERFEFLAARLAKKSHLSL